MPNCYLREKDFHEEGVFRIIKEGGHELVELNTLRDVQPQAHRATFERYGKEVNFWAEEKALEPEHSLKRIGH